MTLATQPTTAHLDELPSPSRPSRGRRDEELFTPGDIHRVGNPGDGTAISIHVYGTDLSRIGSSLLRYYDLDVRQEATGEH